MPSHHGHVTSWASPPRLEITLPVPRQGGQGIRSGVGSSLDTAPEASGRSPIVPEVGRTGTTGATPPPPRAGCTSATCARRCSPGCSPAAGGGRFLMRVEDLDARRVAARARGRAARGPRRARAWSATSRPSGSPSAWRSTTTAIARLDRDGALYRCWCTRAEIREAASAPHGPLPEGAYPGTCRELTAAERAERERSGRPPALRLARRRRAHRVHRPAARSAGGRRRRPRRAPQRRRPRLQPRGRGRRRRPGHRGGRARRGPRRDDPAPAPTSAAGWACGPSPTRTCRSCSAPTARGWPSATAR